MKSNKGPLFFETTRKLKQHEIIQAKDWIEWTPGAWTRIEWGSVFIGKKIEQTQPGLNFRRDA